MNFLLLYRYIDGDYKLIEFYCFVIYGGIDGFFRLVVYLYVFINNCVSIVFVLFREIIKYYNVLLRVWSDRGLENIEVGWFMI